MIENQTELIPGSINTFQLRAQEAYGPFGGPMLSLISGRYPSSATEMAVTSGVAQAFHLREGTTWRVGGLERRVVGTVENPQSLLDEFALVVPGQVHGATAVTALFDAPGVALSSIGNNVETPATVKQSNPFNPETISLAALVLGMLLIALVSIGGFTVLAQRRLRSIGMLESTGATDRHVRLVVSANGTVVGIVGAILGFLLGLAVWLAYRPNLEQSSHHVIGVLALPWTVVIAAMVLAVTRPTSPLLARRERSPRYRSSRRSRADQLRLARSIVRRSPVSSFSSLPSCCWGIPVGPITATGAVVRRSLSLDLSFSSPG